ncbi:S-adenosyl-L-methionine-dependent methyltransferase [Drechmeria coniospora]|uniref:S-adenosyl-L-methionine-dependent methyltransferase n=1 Tax=Drechmeria coniospora TaxID=98403 RepID=A0A151GHD1_DRECN|nr:S-adenosyl-L-methionine-dependent methyltransferase [Drechmeria coniospora]KYK56525.1 S-adenosyl-L-methionine-dependent methyltransferase [Drechmeria coniospora]
MGNGHDAVDHRPDQAGSPTPSLAFAALPPTIEAASQPGEENEFEINEEPFNDGTASVSSSVYAFTYERGRRYHCFKNGRYPIPNDDQEQEREDMKHAMLMELTDGTPFYAPTGDHPQTIVDVGTGTGELPLGTLLPPCCPALPSPALPCHASWHPRRYEHGRPALVAVTCRDMTDAHPSLGDRYPSARVLGIDLTPIQPVWLPPNVEFLVDDCEKEWLVADVDLVHFRFMAIFLHDINLVLSHAYKSMRPGGWVEFQELDGTPFCDDGTMTDDDAFQRLHHVASEAYAALGMSMSAASRLESVLIDAGFVNIHCKILKVPIGVWAKDKTMRLIGLYQKTAVLEFMPAMAGRPFEALGIPAAEAQLKLAMARKALEDTTVHRYFNYYFWYAQKPTEPMSHGP